MKFPGLDTTQRYFISTFAKSGKIKQIEKRKPIIAKLDKMENLCRNDWEIIGRFPGTQEILGGFKDRLDNIKTMLDHENEKSQGERDFEIVKLAKAQLKSVSNALRLTVSETILAASKLDPNLPVLKTIKSQETVLVNTVRLCKKVPKTEANKYAERIKALRKPPWSVSEENEARQLQAEMMLTSAPVTTTDNPGASESFVLEGPQKGSKGLVFKPMDGENMAGYGWEKGGGAPREVMVSALNEHFKDTTGLDFGVSRTSLVKLDHPSLASVNNGKKTERVGAAQDFVVASNKKMGNFRKDHNSPIELPTEEVHKVFLLDFVTLQLDRNEDNFLFPEGENGKVGVTPIDAGNSLPSPKAFKAFRRNFTAGALFQTSGADEKFSKETLLAIEKMDPEKTVEAMRRANAQMTDVDPTAGSHLEDANLEMTARSIKFLKATASRFTPRQLGDGYAFVFQKVLDAKSGEVDNVIEQAIVEMELRGQLFEKLKSLNYETVLADLGWPTGQTSFMNDDPSYLLRLVLGKKECTPVMEEYRKGLEQIEKDKVSWNERALKLYGTRFQNFDSKPFALRYNTVRDQCYPMPTAEERYVSDGGDELLKETGQFEEGMKPGDKAKALYKILYDKMDGDKQVEVLVEAGFNVRDLVTKGNYEGLVLDFRAWEEYQKLGGEERYVELGGMQGAYEGVRKKLAALKQLEMMQELRKEEEQQK